MKRHAVLRLHPDQLVDEARGEAMAEGDTSNGGSGLGALLNDLGFEGLEYERHVGGMK